MEQTLEMGRKDAHVILKSSALPHANQAFQHQSCSLRSSLVPSFPSVVQGSPSDSPARKSFCNKRFIDFHLVRYTRGTRVFFGANLASLCNHQTKRKPPLARAL